MNDYREKIVRNKITLISFTCSILVIWVHSYNVESYGINVDSNGIGGVVWEIEGFWSQIIRIAVPTFFLISGFLFFRTFSWDKLVDKYKSRAKSIFLPYIVWSTLYYLFFVLLTNAPIIKEYMNTERKILSLSNWLMALWPESYYTLWFLKNLICFIVAAPIIYILLNNYFKIPTGLIILILVIMNATFGWISTPRGIEMFAVGSYIAINHKKMEYFKNKWLSYIGIVVALFLFVTRLLVLNVLLMLVFILAIWYALDLVNLDFEAPWWLSITFFTYMFHDMVLEMLEKLLLLVGGKRPEVALLDYLFMPVITFLVIVLVAFVLKKIKPLWGLLSGYR